MANQEYIADIEVYRKESAIRIAANEKSIAEFNTRIELKEKKPEPITSNKLQTWKKRIDDYKAEGKEKWEKFKEEFNHSMDELANAFKYLTVNNKK